MILHVRLLQQSHTDDHNNDKYMLKLDLFSDPIIPRKLPERWPIPLTVTADRYQIS